MKKPTLVLSEQDKMMLKGYEEQDRLVKEQIKTLPKESQEAIAIVNQTFDEMNKDIFDFDAEARIRSAGWTNQQAEDIAKLSRKHGVGQIFQYAGKLLVLSPFKTVVEAQIYLTAVQDRLLQTTTVPVELEISQLKEKLSTFTSASFFGLMALAFKRLFKTEKNNG